MKRFVVLKAGKLSERVQLEEMGWYRNLAMRKEQKNIGQFMYEVSLLVDGCAMCF
jgi:hypothetical protein